MQTLLLHTGGFDVDFGLGVWHLEPTAVTGAFIAASVFSYGLIELKPAIAPWRILAFYAGVIAMFTALASPLDAAADRSLSMHMLQHVFLTTIGPPLLLLGLSPVLVDPLLRPRLINRAARTLTHPVFAGTLFILNMWFWHIPPVYGAAIDYIPVHITMHLAFMGTGILFWWPVIQPSSIAGRHGEGVRLLYLFATGMPMALLALLFFASSGVIYGHYASVEPLWGLSPTDDQQIAGLVMGALGEAASFAAITILFFRFLDHEEQASPAAVQGPLDVA